MCRKFRRLNHSRGLSSFPSGPPRSIRSLGDFLRAPHWSRTIRSLASSRSSLLATLRARSVRTRLPPISFTLDRLLIPLDTSFWDGLGVSGWVPKSQRGWVNGRASNVPSSYCDKVVVAWNNSDAQYWYAPRIGRVIVSGLTCHNVFRRTRASSDGSFTSPPMKPGTYTQTREFLNRSAATTP